MAYGFQVGESFSDGLKRIAVEQIQAAVQHLQSGANLETQVHKARKSLKKTRAVLRLLKDDLGPACLAESKRLQQLGREISALRDAHVMLNLVDAFSRKHGLIRRLAEVRARLAENRSMLERQAGQAHLFGELTASLNAVQKRVAEWPAFAVSGNELEARLEHNYRQGRRALNAVHEDAMAERFHDLRKRAKTHLYQLSLVNGMTADRFRDRMTALKELSDCLGRQHDLVILLSTMPAGHPAASRAESEKQRLEKRALAIADRLFASKPRELRVDLLQFAVSSFLQ